MTTLGILNTCFARNEAMKTSGMKLNSIYVCLVLDNMEIDIDQEKKIAGTPLCIIFLVTSFAAVRRRPWYALLSHVLTQHVWRVLN